MRKETKEEKMYKPFPITSICRADLKEKGFDVSEVDDSTMEELASKMGEAYTDQVFWIDLNIIAEFLAIPKIK